MTTNPAHLVGISANFTRSRLEVVSHHFANIVHCKKWLYLLYMLKVKLTLLVYSRSQKFQKTSSKDTFFNILAPFDLQFDEYNVKDFQTGISLTSATYNPLFTYTYRLLFLQDSKFLDHKNYYRYCGCHFTVRDI